MTLLSSERFEVTVVGTHGVNLPEAHVKPFVIKGLKRVRFKAFFNTSEITFHGAIHLYNGNYVVSFGKRYQSELGINRSDNFQLQLIEDDSKYGVDVPEEFAAVFETDEQASILFEACTDGQKRSLIYYVLGFKNSQTKIDKALLIAENLKKGITDTKELVKHH